MGRGAGSQSSASSPQPRNNKGQEPPAAAVASIYDRLSRVSNQVRALRLALEPFEPDFDLAAWTEYFHSGEPEDINLVAPVNNNYINIVDHIIETSKKSASHTGLIDLQQKRKARQAIAAINQDGGISNKNMQLISDLIEVRDQLGHQSPDVQADEVHTAVNKLLKMMPSFLKQYQAWLAKHGLDPAS